MAERITSDLVLAYFHCPRKAYLLCKGETGDPHEIDSILERKARVNREQYLRELGQSGDLVFTNVSLRPGNFEASCEGRDPKKRSCGITFRLFPR